MGNEIYLYEQGQQRLRGDEMYPLIDKEATGKQIKRFMDCRGITVKQVQEVPLVPMPGNINHKPEFLF